jgi:hypothetical protein
MKLVLSLVSVALILVLGVCPMFADITVSNGNSAFTVSPNSSSGMYNWTVDGVNQMFQQWFWVRVGATGGEHDLSFLDAAPVVAAAGRTLDLTYTTATFSVDVLYTLTGGAAGTHTSDIAESINITNLTGSALDFHFFQYSDFDLNGITTGQTATLVNANAVQQSGAGGLVMSETVATPSPTHHEMGIWNTTLASLQDGAPTTLNDVSSAGPGDVTWAFQWDASIAGNGSLIISKDKRLSSVVPEPASILGLGTVLFLIGTKLRRKRA